VQPLERLRARLPGAPLWFDQALPQSAVLVALDDRTPPLSVVLTRRAAHLRLHAGEVAFPGGKCDEDDDGFWGTALREAEEEIALPAQHIEPIGFLAPLVTRTGIQVTPCVGRLRQRAELTPNPAELEAVFEAPLEFFADPAHLCFDRHDYAGRSRRVPRYEYGQFTVWGITAAILVSLVNVACDAGIEMEEYWRGGPVKH
jgi:8-oxo-dGTP pyrophosphatase MutT (NUDIX family)